MAELSPMMRQYLEIKNDNPDCILFFRLGDFYEMFFDDAKIASAELELTLTGRDCGLEERAPMCGVPFHSYEPYAAKLVSRGYRVAICEQVEDPSAAKGIVRREVIRTLTPGTAIDDSMLDEGRNNYLCSLFFKDGGCGACFVDASTGLLHLTEVLGNDASGRIEGELGRFAPTEMIAPEGDILYDDIAEFAHLRIGTRLTARPKSDFLKETAKEIVLEHFKVLTPEELGIGEDSPALIALGSALCYLYETRKAGLEIIDKIDFYKDDQYMRLDISAMRNLELLETMRGSKKGSLLWVIDKTKTALGKRRLRGMLEQPLVNMAEITSRLNALEELYSQPMIRGEIREVLSGVKDIERLMTRVIYGSANPKELNTLADTISCFPSILANLSGCSSKLLSNIRESIDPLEDVMLKIRDVVAKDPATLVREGGIIREGYSKELDELRFDFTDGKNIIYRIENEQRELTGIKALKVRYNKVFGYYIEVPNSFKGEVPETYIRKQTLVNCERYITDELKNLESRVLGARERANQLEFQIFDELRRQVAGERERILKTADAIARLDVVASLSEVAVSNDYTRPALNQEGKISITGGRHPVVELISKNAFVPNDTLLDENENRCMIITGPNMAGKSTYMRQVALISIMAQIGSFVPASVANIPIVDAVFTRVGASDDLASGQSTFMVEMSEVAYILKNASSRSLLILDEIGRGTSTYDGMSIARAVLEYCADKKKLGAKTLFATHYHVLTSLEDEVKGVKNYNITVKKRGDDITFLRKIMRGGADRSYGIEVAKLSGIPSSVINRAKQVLVSLEAEGSAPRKAYGEPEDNGQISFFQNSASMLIEELKLTDVNNMTPMEALSELNAIIEKAKTIN